MGAGLPCFKESLRNPVPLPSLQRRDPLESQWFPDGRFGFPLSSKNFQDS
jgi:hypothetical protein